MNIDLTSVIQAVLGLCGVAITIFGGIALQALARRFNVQVSAGQTAAFDAALDKSVTYGVTASEAAIAAKGWDHVDVKNQVLATGLAYAVQSFPQALKGVGLTTNLSDPQNAATITAALQRALPAAMLTASASPATPPAPVQAVVQTATPLPVA